MVILKGQPGQGHPRHLVIFIGHFNRSTRSRSPPDLAIFKGHFNLILVILSPFCPVTLDILLLVPAVRVLHSPLAQSQLFLAQVSLLPTIGM